MKYLLIFFTLIIISHSVYANNSILFMTDKGGSCSGVPIEKDTFYTVKHCIPDEATKVVILMPNEKGLTRYISDFERIVDPEHESKEDYPLKIKIEYDAFTDIFPVDGNARAHRYEVHCTLFNEFTYISRAKIIVEDVSFDDVITSESSAIMPGCSGGGLFAMTFDGPVLIALVRQITYSTFYVGKPLTVYNEAIYEELEGNEDDFTDYGGRR